MKKTFFLLTGVLFILLFFGCPNTTEPPSETPKSNNAYLQSLEVSDGFSLEPSFTRGILEYSVTVPYETTSLTITGKTADSKATMEPKSGVVILNDLKFGETKATIKVKAEDGTEKTYTVRINRDLGPTNAYLQSLEVSDGFSLEPSFTRGILEYTVTVPNSVKELTVTGTKADDNATMTPSDGKLSFTELLVGTSDEQTIKVTSEDGSVTKEYKVKVTRFEELEMCPVPAGSFQREEGEKNISEITKPYYLGKYQITRQQFKDIMGTDPSSTGYSSGMDDPVQYVNWYHAIAFCNKLSLLEGLTPAYTVSGVSNWANLAFGDIPIDENANWNAATCDWEANGYRLPTEMEWMWAAMGADKDARADAIDAEGINRTGWSKNYAEEGYGTGTSIDDYAWYYENSGKKTHPVGGKLPNELGLYDMSGNVFEWCWDWYGTYPIGTLTDYSGAGSVFYGVLRGGSWGRGASNCTVAYRSLNNPYYQIIDGGFRVLRPDL